jgi:hypothetical protein
MNQLPDLGGIPCQSGLLPAGNRAVGIRPALHLVVMIHLLTDPRRFARTDVATWDWSMFHGTRSGDTRLMGICRSGDKREGQQNACRNQTWCTGHKSSFKPFSRCQDVQRCKALSR